MRQTFGRISLSFELLDSGSNRRTPKSKLQRISHLDWIPQQMREFYAESNGQSFEWRTPSGDSSRPACQGKLNLLPLETAYRDWKGIVYFDFTENKRLQHFKIIDYFADEACVGIFHDEQQDQGLYYYYLGENDGPYPLYLDLDGYLTMLTQSLGYCYWPLAVLALIPEKDPERPRHIDYNFSNRFRQDMSVWVPSFDYDAFITLYQQIKLPN